VKSIVSRFIEKRFSGTSTVIRKKASLLTVMNLVIMAVVIPIPPVVLAIRGDILRPAIIALPVIISMAVSLFALYRGRYAVAANITSAGTTLAIVIGVAYQFHGTPTIGFSSMTYLVCTGIIFAALFCTRRWTTVLSILLFIGNIAFYRISLAQQGIDRAVLTTGLFDSSITLIFLYTLAMLILKVSRDSMEELKEESEKNRRQYITLRELLQSATSVSNELAALSERMSEMTDRFSDNSQNQAASVEEITSAVEEVHAGMELVERNTGNQFAGVESLIGKLRGLSDSIGTMKDRISETAGISRSTSARSAAGASTLESMNTSMASLMESSRQMTGIVDVIRGIADRISLLSLNAAIEAARAGDAGRGFAVVADEISKLSEQTAESLAEISKLIASTDRDVGIGINGVEETVGLLRATIDNVNRITAGVEEIDRLMAEQVGINDIVNDHALEVRSRYDEIRISTTEQMIALSEVAKSVGTINELTQSNAEGATALAGLSRQVEASAEVLKKQIGSYRGDGAGA